MNRSNQPSFAELPPSRAWVSVTAVVHVAAVAMMGLAFISFTKSDALDTGLNASRVVELALIVMAAGLIGCVALTNNSWRQRYDRGALQIMGAFCAWALFSAAWSPSKFLTVGKCGELALIAIAASVVGSWAASYLRASKSLATLVAVALGGVICTMLAYNVVVHGTPLGMSQGGRPRLILGFTHPLQSADCIALALIATLASGMRLPLKMLALLPLLGLYALCQPRGSLAGMCMALTAIGIMRIRRVDARVFLVGGLVLLAAAALLFIGDDVPKLMDILVPDDAETLNGRTDLWAYVLQLIAHKPLLGYGYFASRFLLLDLFPWAGQAHNSYLEIMLTTGVPGMACFLALMIHIARVAVRGGDTLLLGVAAYCYTVSFFDPTVLVPGVPHVVLMMAVMHAGTRCPVPSVLRSLTQRRRMGENLALQPSLSVSRYSGGGPL